MAARKSYKCQSWPEQRRARIDTSILLKHLMNHVKGKQEMSATQIRAAEILLNKTLPNLASVEHSGEVALPYAIVLEPCETNEEWEQKYAPNSVQ